MSYDLIVNLKLPCKQCGVELTQWQTQDMGEQMRLLNVEQLGTGCEVTDICPKCGTYNQYRTRVVMPPVILLDYDAEGDYLLIPELYATDLVRVKDTLNRLICSVKDERVIILPRG